MTQRIVLVTGGGRGIGAATCRLAAARGYAVCVNYQKNHEAASRVVVGIEAAGGMVLTRQLAMAHGQMALAAIVPLADSPARTALAAMVVKVLNRTR